MRELRGLIVKIFRQKSNPLQSLEAEVKKATKAKKKENNKPIVVFIALLTVGLLGAYLVHGTPQNPRQDQIEQAAQDQKEAQAALIQNNYPSTADSHSSIPPGESPAQVADAFTQLASNKPTEIATQLKPIVPEVDRSPAEQKKRRALLADLTNKGIFIRAELPDNLPRLWVGPAFHSLELHTKETYVSIVHAYYLDGSDQHASVRIFDGRTNKEIGDFTLAAGLKLNPAVGIRR